MSVISITVKNDEIVINLKLISYDLFLNVLKFKPLHYTVHNDITAIVSEVDNYWSYYRISTDDE